jgi:hypothetical protein
MGEDKFKPEESDEDSIMAKKQLFFLYSSFVLPKSHSQT